MFLFVTIVCALVFIGLLGLAFTMLLDDDPVSCVFFIVIAALLALGFFNVTNNRDETREDTGTVTSVAQFIDHGPEMTVVQFDGYKVSHITCSLEPVTKCDGIMLGDSVTVRTSYNSVGFTDTQTIVAIEPSEAAQ